MRRYLALVPFALAAVICGQALPPGGQDPLVVGKGFASADGGNIAGNLSVSGNLSLGGTLSGTGLSSGSGTGTFNGFTSSDGGSISGQLEFPWSAPTGYNDAGVTWPTTYLGKLVTRTISKIQLDYRMGTGVAATSKDFVLGSWPAKSRISAFWLDHTANFTGGAISALNITCSATTGGGADYLASGTLFSGAPKVLGDISSEQGSNLNSTTYGLHGGKLEWLAGGNIVCRLVATSANLSALTAGSADIYFVLERYE